MTRNTIHHVLTGNETVLDSIIDDSLTHIDDAVATNIGQRPTVQSSYHPLLSLDGQVSIKNSLEFGKVDVRY